MLGYENKSWFKYFMRIFPHTKVQVKKPYIPLGPNKCDKRVERKLSRFCSG